nr:hypothetical protein [Tanacetum cinerariifolium]
GSNPGGGCETRGGGDGLEGSVANRPSLTHKGYLVTFVVEEVLETATIIINDFIIGGELNHHVHYGIKRDKLFTFERETSSFNYFEELR